MLDLEFYAPVAFSSSVTPRFGIPNYSDNHHRHHPQIISSDKYHYYQYHKNYSEKKYDHSD